MRRNLLVLLLLFGSLFLISCQKDENVLVVGLEASYAPFNWATNEKSEFTHPLHGRPDYADGYDVQIAKMIASELGMKLVIKAIEWDGLPSALDSGDIDLILAGMTDTPERATSILFTNEYFKEEPVILVRKDSPYVNATSLDDFDGAKAVAQRGTIYEDLVDELTGAIALEHLDDYGLLHLALTNKEADIVIAEKPVALGMVDQDSDLTFISFAEGEGFDDVTVSIGLKLGRTELRDQINTILASLSQEQRKTMMDKAVERQ